MSPGAWHRTMVYLGLKDDLESGYDDVPEAFEAPEEHEPERPAPAVQRRPPRQDPDLDAMGNVRSLHTGDVEVVRPGANPTAPLRTPVIEILVFDDVEQVGARYRTGQPVLFDLTKADQQTGRRIVDFVSGLTYISRGRLTKVGDPAFLLVPEGMELSDAERRRLGDMGYDIPGGGDV